jgi:dipeptidyl aminopeptidase/acylaminoacyl peptidase
MNNQRFTLHHLLGLLRPSNRVPLSLSPDGRLLAVSTQQMVHGDPVGQGQFFTPTGVSIELTGSRVQLVNTETGESRAPFPSGGDSWAARWSPNGTHLAAYVENGAHACLAICEVETGTIRIFHDAPVSPLFGFEVPQWTPDGNYVAVKLTAADVPISPDQDVQHSESEAPVITVHSFDPDAKPEESENIERFDPRCDLALVDVLSGQVHCLARNWLLRGWRVAPDGHAVAVLRQTAFIETEQQNVYDLLVLPCDGTSVRTVASHITQEYGLGFQWSPDSRSIAYTVSRRGSADAVFAVGVAGLADPIELTGGLELALQQDYEGPRWSTDSKRVLCLAADGIWVFELEGGERHRINAGLEQQIRFWVQPAMEPTFGMFADQSVLVVVRDESTKNDLLVRIEQEGGQCQAQTDLSGSCVGGIFGVDVDYKGKTCYMLIETAEHPPEIHRVAQNENVSSRLCSFNSELEGVTLGSSCLVDWLALDGQQERGALMLPPDYQEGQQVPLIVSVYGGSLGSNSLSSFGFGGYHYDNAHLLAGQGYAVLYPDIPLEPRGPMSQLPDHVLPAVNRLVDMGIADPERIGLMGHSFGGYCVLALLVQSGRFAAAVSAAPWGINLTSMYAWNTGWCESGQAQLSGSPWERRAAYIETSPFFYLDRLRTPLLLICGTADQAATAQAKETFNALRRLKRRVELLLYKDEDHWPAWWSEKNLTDVYDRVLAWFDTYLGTPKGMQSH